MADGELPIWKTDPKPRQRQDAVFIGILALIAIAVLIHGLLIGRHAGPRTTAQVIAAGYDRSRALSSPDAEDDQLPGAESDAGYMWAKAHRIERLSQCASYSVEFRRGCADYLGAPGP